MQVIEFRRQFRNLLPTLNRLALPLLVLEGLLIIGLRAEAATPVALITVTEEAAYSATRTYAGRTRASQAADIGFKRAGQLDRVLVRLGDRVESGQLLATLDQDALQAALDQAEAEVAVAAASRQAAEARAELAHQTERRFAELRRAGHVSAQDLDERTLDLRARRAEVDVAAATLARARAAREAARIARDEALLHAPFAGVVQARHLDPGSQLQPQQALFRLVSDTGIEAHIGVPEGVAGTLRPQATYALHWRGRELAATLTALLPEVEAGSRTLTAVFELEPADVPLGTVIELPLTRLVPASGFWLPLAALTEGDRGLWGVYVIDDDSMVERRLVDVVHVEAQRAFVRGTLADGERIVAGGVQRLVPGQRVLAAAR